MVEADRIRSQDIVTDSEINPKVRQACEREFKGPRRANAKRVMELFGMNVGRPISVDFIEEFIGNRSKEVVFSILATLVKNSEFYRERYGFYLTKDGGDYTLFIDEVDPASEGIAAKILSPESPVHPNVQEVLTAQFTSEKRKNTAAVLRFMGQNTGMRICNEDVVRYVTPDGSIASANKNLATLAREFPEDKGARNGFYIERTTEERAGFSPQTFYTLRIVPKREAAVGDFGAKPKPSNTAQVHPLVSYVCEHDLQSEGNTRLILEFMGRNPFMPISYEEIIEHTEVKKRQNIHKSIHALIRLTEKYRETYGFYIEKVPTDTRRVYFVLRILPGREAPDERATRSVAIYQGDAVMKVTEEMKRAAENVLRKSGIEIPVMDDLRGQLEYIRALLDRATWIIRREKPEWELVKSFTDASMGEEGQMALRTSEVLRNFDIEDKSLLHRLADKTTSRAVELGFFLMQVKWGYFALFILERRQRMAAALAQENIIYLEKTVPFDYDIVHSRLAATTEGLSERQQRIMQIAALRYQASSPATTQEICDELKLTPAQVRYEISKLAENRHEVGMYMRYREDTRIEVVLLDTELQPYMASGPAGLAEEEAGRLARGLEASQAITNGLRDDLVAAQGALAVEAEAKKKLEADLRAASGELESANQSLLDERQELGETQRLLSVEQGVTSELREDLKDARSALGAKTADTARLEGELSEERSKTAGLRGELEESLRISQRALDVGRSKDAELRRLAEELGTSTQLLSEEKAVTSGLKGELEGSQTRVRELEESLGSQGVEIARLGGELSEGRAKTEGLQEDLETAQRTLGVRDEEIVRLKATISDETEKVTRLGHELLAEQGTTSGLREDLGSTRRLLEEERGTTAGLKGQIERLGEDLQTERQISVAKDAELERLRTRIKTLEKDLEDALTELDEEVPIVVAPKIEDVVSASQKRAEEERTRLARGNTIKEKELTEFSDNNKVTYNEKQALRAILGARGEWYDPGQNHDIRTGCRFLQTKLPRIVFEQGGTYRVTYGLLEQLLEGYKRPEGATDPTPPAPASKKAAPKEKAPERPPRSIAELTQGPVVDVHAFNEEWGERRRRTKILASAELAGKKKGGL